LDVVQDSKVKSTVYSS